MRIGFVCRVFYRGKLTDGRTGWYLDQFDVPNESHGPFITSPQKAERAVYDMVNQLEDEGHVVLEAQAHEIHVNEQLIVREMRTFTLVAFDGGPIHDRRAEEMNGVLNQSPQWELVREARLSPEEDDEYTNFYGHTVVAKVGEKVPAAMCHPYEIFREMAA